MAIKKIKTLKQGDDQGETCPDCGRELEMGICPDCGSENEEESGDLGHENFEDGDDLA